MHLNSEDYAIVEWTPAEQRRAEQLRRASLESALLVHARPRPQFERTAVEGQVSLRTLLGLMSFAALSFAVGHRLPPPLFAGLCGLAAIAFPAAVALGPLSLQSVPLLRQIWYMLVVIYGLAIVVAVAPAP